MHKALDYDFYKAWAEANPQLRKPFGRRIPDEDRQRARKYIAEIFSSFSPDRPIEWLDVGAGEGITLEDIFRHIPQFAERTLRITAIEPDPHAAHALKTMFSKYPNINATIVEHVFDTSVFIQNKYDFITLLHANYYLANTRSAFEQLYTQAYDSLKKNGYLLLQSVSSTGDFQELGHAPYSLWSCGDKAYEIFKDLWGPAVMSRECPIHFDVSAYVGDGALSPKITWELEQFYLFVKHDASLTFTDQEREPFIEHMREMASAQGGGTYLDFKDWIVWVRKV